jgi:hypothetical protein
MVSDRKSQMTNNPEGMSSAQITNIKIQNFEFIWTLVLAIWNFIYRINFLRNITDN